MLTLTPIVPALTSSKSMETSNDVHTPAAGVDIATLTTALAKGDEKAFTTFHELYFDRLFRYHLVIARGDESSACDALQETFLRVVRHARCFASEEAFWCWLTALCRSAAVDGGRKRQRYWKLLAEYARSLLPFQADRQKCDDTDQRLQEIIAQSLNELAPDERALVEGKYFDRSSMKELAKETGLTERAVESRLLRARRELREKISTRLNHES